MADIEATARRALAEVRDAVSGYRQVSCGSALAEARAALSAAGISLSAPRSLPTLPGAVDAVLGWVVREATTNVLRHSGARTVTVTVGTDDDGAALTVTDDGRGVGGGASPVGAGLSGLASASPPWAAGWTPSGPGGGFRLCARVPVAAGAHVAAP